VIALATAAAVVVALSACSIGSASRSFNEAIVSDEFRDQMADELHEESYGDDDYVEQQPADESTTAGEIPARFTIIPDDYHAELVGTAQDGRRFFVATPFGPSSTYVAVFLWTADGTFDEIRIDDLGPRNGLDFSAEDAAIEKRLAELGDYTIEPITVAPFAVGAYGETFGFVPHVPPEGTDDAWISLLPGDYMAYYAPWNGEDYDT
jgi:hypothetical protein